jgi:phage I-like protein
MKSQSRFLISCTGPIFDPVTTTLPMEIDAMIEGDHGRHQRTDGRMVDVIITASDINAAVDYIKRRRQREPNRTFVVDYEHQTLSGEKAPAAGWFKDLTAITRNGVRVARATIDSWTSAAARMIMDGEYRYISPVFAQNVVDPDSGQFETCMLINMALTNEPFLKNMMPIAASKFLNPKEDFTMNKLTARMCEVYQLTADASEDAIIAKFNETVTSSAGTIAARNKIVGVIGMKAEDTTEAVVAKLTDLVAAQRGALTFKGEVLTALGLKSEATLEEVKVLVISGKNNSTHLAVAVAKLADLEGKEFNREFDRIIAKAFFEGRIHPTQPKDAEWLKSNKDLFKAKGSDGYEEYWSKQPAIAPVGKLPTDVVAAKAGGLSDEETAVAKQVGVSVETVKLHNKA